MSCNSFKPSSNEESIPDVNIEKFDYETCEHEKVPYVMLCTSVIQNITDPFAGFIWAYLQSLPSNWNVNKTHIMNHFSIGEDKYDKHIRFLKASNLVQFRRERDERGVFKKGVLRVLNGSKFIQIPTGGKTPPMGKMLSTSTGGVFQAVDNPGGGKHPPLTNNISNTNLKEKELIAITENSVDKSQDLKNFIHGHEPVVVVEKTIINKTTDNRLLVLKESRGDVYGDIHPKEFLLWCAFHLESGDYNKFNHAQQIDGLCKIIARGTFQAPAGFGKKKLIQQTRQKEIERQLETKKRLSTPRKASETALGYLSEIKRAVL